MKIRTLTGAIIAGMTLTAGTANVQAMNLNPLGNGQVLVYPYYTVNAANQTVVSVINKTDAGKAVKVTFREGRNSRAVFALNVYLSPFDTWTAAVFSQSDIGTDAPANLITNDHSCTVPRIKNNNALPAIGSLRYAPFYNSGYTGGTEDAGPNSLDRTREGHFEMIEMGEVVDRENTTLTTITHGSNGAPANCVQIENAWLPIASPPVPVGIAYWTNNAMVDMSPPRGGLFGAAAIVDALGGTMMSYNADAIDGFSDIAQHTAPDAPAPTLASARTTAATAVASVFDGGAVVTSTYPSSRAVDAVSALFMQDEIFNEFVIAASAGAKSEWVVTMPTKYLYTDEAIVGTTAIAPFTSIFPRVATAVNNGLAPERYEQNGFDREERLIPPIEMFVSPPPPRPAFAWASNVIRFPSLTFPSSDSLLGAGLVSGEFYAFNGTTEGWARIRLHAADLPALATHRLRPDLAGGVWNGLPVTGFLATSYTNGQLQPGVLSNYAALYRHRGENRYSAAQ